MRWSCLTISGPLNPGRSLLDLLVKVGGFRLTLAVERSLRASENGPSSGSVFAPVSTLGSGIDPDVVPSMGAVAPSVDSFSGEDGTAGASSRIGITLGTLGSMAGISSAPPLISSYVRGSDFSRDLGTRVTTLM